MQRRPTDTENKLLLLHTIERLSAVTAQQLLLFMVENDFMDYISLQLLLAELTESGHLRRHTHEVGVLYTITAEGLNSLAMFKKRLPITRLAAVDEVAESWRVRFRREKQMLSSFGEKDGEYWVRLRLLEWDQDLLDLRLTLPTRREAQRFCDGWTQRAPEVYAAIMHALGQDDKNPPETP